MVLRSRDDSLWSARFTPVAQPSLMRVAVHVSPAHASDVKLVAYPIQNPR